ncbi:DoxX family membrane protein [Cohnella sp. 56]|uniref:DoxX family membrane protein n=1 Tax=Cohnella sp. 56 TaxID=3113722 RepID=UPI0030E80280
MYEISVHIVRLLLGLVFVAGAVNGLFVLAGKRPFMPVNARATGDLVNAGYLYPLVKVTELAAGLLLLTGLYVPVALLLLAPVVLCILLAHMLHDKPLIWAGLLLLALELYLGGAYWTAFAPLFETGL